MSRLGKTKLLREGHRRSPRLSALENLKVQHPKVVGFPTTAETGTQQMMSHLGNGQGPACRTRAAKQRRLPTSSATSNFGPVEASQDHLQTSRDQPCGTVLSSPRVQEKCMLELVLDILQKRDTYDIFAQPVDPNEVKDYYKIIEDPMDFGTMRAKLQQGMYKDLEQFEHDTFLVTGNAMYFNSSASIYFRQARSVHELAKKVFHVLKPCPENLELEFSETRQRTSRKGQGAVGTSAVYPEVVTNLESLIDPSKAMQSPLGSSLDIRRCDEKRGRSGIAAKEHILLSGTKDDIKSRPIEANARNTYRPWKSNLDENESIGLTISSDSNQHEQVIQQGIDYKESLMLFAKDLGPTAKMVAIKKILECFQLQKNQSPLASTSTQRTNSTTGFAAAPSHGHPTIMKSTYATFELPSCCDKKISHCEFHQNPQMNSHPFIAHTGYRSCFDSGFKNSSQKSTEMVLNQGMLANQAQSLVSPSSQTNLWRNLGMSSLSNKRCSNMMTPMAPVYLRGGDELQAVQLPTPDQVNPVAPQFTFGLPYMRDQFGMINSSGQDGFLHKASSAGLNYSDKRAVRESHFVPATWK